MAFSFAGDGNGHAYPGGGSGGGGRSDGAEAGDLPGDDYDFRHRLPHVAAQMIQVTMTISSSSQAIRLSHAGLTFTAVQQGGVTPPQTFAVMNIGTGAMNWTATTTTLSGGQWLLATPRRDPASPVSTTDGHRYCESDWTRAWPLLWIGTNHRSWRSEYAACHHCDFAGIAVGTDIDEVVVPNELVFVAIAGANSPGSQSVFAYNIAATPKTYSSSVFLSTVWINVNYFPGQATLALDAPTEIVVQPVTDSLAPGVYHGDLTLQFSDGRVRNVRLHFIVRGAGQCFGYGRSRPTEADCTPSKLVPTLTSIGQSFIVPAGWPVALQARLWTIAETH